MNQNYLIAVVDDDQHIRNLVEAYLRKEGYKTVGLGTAEEGWEMWRTNPPDMWVLDIMLPGWTASNCADGSVQRPRSRSS